MNNQVAIVTESASNLPGQLVEQYNISVLPLKLNWGDETLLDGVDISSEEVYRRQRDEDYFPKTNTFSPGELKLLIEDLAGWASEVLAILTSGKLTTSVQIANLVQTMELPVPLHVIDSRTAAMAQGFVVLEAARAAAEGLKIEKVLTIASNMAARVHFLGAIETLKYLHRMGRVSWPQAALGSVLKITPIIALRPGDGEISGISQPRTWNRACERLIKLMAQDIGDSPVHVAVSHVRHEESASEIAEEIQDQFDVEELYINHLTPVMGAASGPILALSYYGDE
jgi:DegV family protein with EDD domain